ncbi:unnamed protein product [Bemisia tabaci]|uniref:Rho-GAP domain-containing protein n=1 Tax=Bemisia tabaci TaxID=7038 RepID=A0A9P0ALC5_BEMTA|nr:unnamed protein product [Bemisia tabaci]
MATAGQTSKASDVTEANEEIAKIQELTSLTLSIQKLKESLKILTRICSRVTNKDDLKNDINVHEALADVLDVLKHMLMVYPVLQSTEILLKAQNLVNLAQGCTVSGKRKDIQESIDELAIAFSIRVSEYVLGTSGEIDFEFTPSINVKKTDRQVSNTSSTSDALTTFGVPLDQHLKATGATIPHIVTKCIQEIDERGILIKGIYRVSGVKSKVEKLCQEFETYGCSVNLSDVHPNVIANVLKLYLRQLPQPLFTFQLYPELIKLAKNWPCTPTKDQSKHCIEELRSLLNKLPKCHYATVRFIMQHLKRVADQNEVNNMSPGNLGIVFGPTVLRLKDTRSCLNSLLDTVHQSRIVELVITHASVLFTNLRKASNS